MIPSVMKLLFDNGQKQPVYGAVKVNIKNSLYYKAKFHFIKLLQNFFVTKLFFHFRKLSCVL